MFCILAVAAYISTNSVQAFPFFHILSIFLYIDFLMMTFLTSVRCIIVLICISLIITSVKHLFLCLLTICISVDKCLLRSFAHFSVGFFFKLLLNCISYLFILENKPLSVAYFANIDIFSYSVDYHFGFIWFYLLGKSL